MKNHLHQVFIQKLEQYRKDISIKKNAEKLIHEIQQTNSFDALLSLLTAYKNKFSPYGSISLTATLMDWENYLQEIKNNHDLAIKTINFIQSSDKTTPLIEFIKELLTSPTLLLHIKINVLLHSLNNNFAQLLNFIINIKQIDAPQNPQRGSFASLKPFNYNHECTISLLNNIAANIQENNPLWHDANSLLQTSLGMYHDLHYVMPEVPPPNKGDCIIL
ncbi:MAG: hypothetical protein PSV35_03275 [bacterium]|nr:hypothetical protein [bacterium]